MFGYNGLASFGRSAAGHSKGGIRTLRFEFE